MPRFATFDDAYEAIWDRSGWDRGYISNPFAGDAAARLGLARTRLVLEQLGNPDARVRLVHIAGSKGKGSTTVMTDAIFRASGLRSGRFTSPHLHTIRERFTIDGTSIDQDDFARVAEEVFNAAGEVEYREPDAGKLTAWEISTVMTLAWFAWERCDVAVMEVGLGGTLDATNVITPGVSVITRLDFEHTAILGTTMPEIAANKAGIIKPGIPVVTVDQPAEGREVIERRAEEQGSELLIAGMDWQVTGIESCFQVTGPWWQYDDLTLALPGMHQVENAGLAIAATEVVRRRSETPYHGTAAHVRDALREASLPGRFEIVQPGPDQVVILDGAHTPASMDALARTVLQHFPDRPIHLVIGMLAGRDPGEVLDHISKIASHITVTTSGSPRSVPASDLARALHLQSIPVSTSGSVCDALATAASRRDSVVVVTGSLGVVAEARVCLGLVEGSGDPVVTT